MHLAPQTGLCKHSPCSPRCQHPRINVSRQEGSVPGFPGTLAPWHLRGGTLLQKLARIQGEVRKPPRVGLLQVPSAGKETVFFGPLWRLARALSLGQGEASLAQNQPEGPPWLREESLLACTVSRGPSGALPAMYLPRGALSPGLPVLIN